MTLLRSREIQSPLPNQTPVKIEPSTPSKTQEPDVVHRSPAIVRRSPRLASLTETKEVTSVSTPAKRKSVDDTCLSLRSGKKIAKRVDETEPRDLDFEIELDSVNVVGEDSDEVLQVESKNKGKGIVEDSDNDDVAVEMPSSSMFRRYTREEKGKAIKVEEDVAVENPAEASLLQEQPQIDGPVEVNAEQQQVINNNNGHVEVIVEESQMIDYDGPVEVNAEQPEVINNNGGGVGNGTRADRFRATARRHASKFAHFDAEIEEEEDLSDKEVEQQVEDWPGPFSTAMKIIKDREEDVNLGLGIFVGKESEAIVWTPRKDCSVAPRRAPSLQDLSLRVLVKNADAISSLDYIPDTLKVKLSQLLCDSRRMNVHFLDLLARGSPTEIRVPDCSWLTEEQFTECFRNCDTSNLTVLQLDQCGACMPDYVLHSTLARSPKNLPVLSSLSLCGAYRLSDLGLQALVSAAPAISSINLSQCSFLTSSSIAMLSDSLGSVLKELYINECQNIDMKLIVPALKKFEKLEVLSLVDLPSMKGRFLREIVIARGKGLKKLILTNSVKLTDASIKAISENCPNLSVLDLANVSKLTDPSLGYLAIGCQSLEKLIFCRNSFNDEAVAAFIETAGGSLKELSLNNVKMVGHNTASALAKRSEKLEILDLSWCRDLSDKSLGHIVDNCLSLKLLKLFGCTQITDVFVRGHSNPNVKIIGLKMDPFMDHLNKQSC